MNLYTTPAFSRRYKKLTRRDTILAEKVKSKIRLFAENPRHPGLALHKLSGYKEETWSFSVASDLRILISYAGEDALLVDIGKHEEVY